MRYQLLNVVLMIVNCALAVYIKFSKYNSSIININRNLLIPLFAIFLVCVGLSASLNVAEIILLVKKNRQHAFSTFINIVLFFIPVVLYKLF